MKKLSEIIETIKKINNLKTDGEVADLLGIKHKTLASAKLRNSIPFEELSDFCKKNRIYLDWLLTDEGPMQKGEEPSYNREEWLAREAAPKHEAKPSEITECMKTLTEIFEEGDKTKITAVFFQLKALRPKPQGENKGESYEGF